MRKFWTFREVCDYLPYSEPTVRRLIAATRRGESTFPISIQVKKGGKHFFDSQEIINWFETQRAPPQPIIPASSSKRRQHDMDYKNRQTAAKAALLARHSVSHKSKDGTKK